MNQTDSPQTVVEKRYEDMVRVASYLEAEWSDYFLPRTSGRDVLPYALPTFYRQVVGWVFEQAAPELSDCFRFCDVGGATGRTLFEIASRRPNLSIYCHCEPARRFSEFARLILRESEQLDSIPLLQEVDSIAWCKPVRKPRIDRSVRERIAIVNSCVEELPMAETYNFVACLNVLDRHQRPKELVERLHSLLAKSGLLVVSSPFAFDESITPDRSNWFDNLLKVFEPERWDLLAERYLKYGFRSYDRKMVMYAAQAVLLRKR